METKYLKQAVAAAAKELKESGREQNREEILGRVYVCKRLQESLPRARGEDGSGE